MTSRRSGILVAVALLIYAALWLGFADDWGWIAAVDNETLRLFHEFGVTRPGWIAFWGGVSSVFGPTGMRFIAALGIGAALLRRRLRTAAFVAVAVMLMGPLAAAAKALSDRPRPDTALVIASSTSFPSGHALGAMVGVLTFGTVLWPLMPARARPPAIVLGTLIVLTVGISRVALNVHHPTDVVAGWALGYLWFRCCFALIPPLSRRSGSSGPQQVSRRSAS